jgi:hypothetical protein
VTAQATDVRFDAVPGHRPAVLDAEFAVDMYGAAAILKQEDEELVAKVRVVTGVVVAPEARAWRAPGGAVVVGQLTAAVAAGVTWLGSPSR